MEMTKQEMFDTVAQHLFAQGRRSRLSPTGTCAYRGIDGTKCAVGALITDEEYKLQMDHSSGITTISEVIRYFPEWMGEHVTFLQGLQFLHDDDDSWVSTANMQTAARSIAETYNLSVEEIKDLSFTDR